MWTKPKLVLFVKQHSEFVHGLCSSTFLVTLGHLAGAVLGDILGTVGQDPSVFKSSR